MEREDQQVVEDSARFCLEKRCARNRDRWMWFISITAGDTTSRGTGARSGSLYNSRVELTSVARRVVLNSEMLYRCCIWCWTVERVVMEERKRRRT